MLKIMEVQKRYIDMKLQDMKASDSNTTYFIHYYDEDKKMWCPYINDKGYSYFPEEYLIYNLTEVKKVSNNYKVFRQTTTRVQ